MNSLILFTRNLRNQNILALLVNNSRQLATTSDSSGEKPTVAKKAAKKTKGKTPKGKLDDEFDDVPKSYNEKEPLAPHPKGVNPSTGVQGGPRGPEPTRYTFFD